MEEATKKNFNLLRILYVGFTVVGFVRLSYLDFSDAAMNFGVAMAFDPFDITVTWKDRPTWQRVWLIVHLALCAACLGMAVGIGGK